MAGERVQGGRLKARTEKVSEAVMIGGGKKRYHVEARKWGFYQVRGDAYHVKGRIGG
jgi:hypothetical protein